MRYLIIALFIVFAGCGLKKPLVTIEPKIADQVKLADEANLLKGEIEELQGDAATMPIDRSIPLPIHEFAWQITKERIAALEWAFDLMGLCNAQDEIRKMLEEARE